MQSISENVSLGQNVMAKALHMRTEKIGALARQLQAIKHM